MSPRPAEEVDGREEVRLGSSADDAPEAPALVADDLKSHGIPSHAVPTQDLHGLRGAGAVGDNGIIVIHDILSSTPKSQ